MDTPQHLLLELLSRGLSLLVIAALIGGVVFALAKRPAIGITAGNLAAAGLGIVTLVYLGDLIWDWFVVVPIIRRFGSGTFRSVFAVYGIANQLLTAGGVALLVAAVFARRPQAAEPPVTGTFPGGRQP